MNYFLNLIEPYLSSGQGSIGDYPVESDICFHINYAMEDLAFKSLKVVWDHAGGKIRLNVEKTLVEARLIGASSNVLIVTSANSRIQNGSLEQDLLQAISLLRRELVGVKVVLLVPDAHARGLHPVKQAITKSIIEDFYPVVDLFLTPFSGTVSLFWNVYKRPDLVDKISYIPVLPTRFLCHDTTSKFYEISYLGSNKNGRRQSMQSALNIEGANVLFSTCGRIPSALNPFRTTQSYLNMMLGSKLSICTPAFESFEIMKMDGLSVSQPAVFPGRVAEAIACGSLPIYVRTDRDFVPEEFSPLPRVDQLIPFVEVSTSVLSLAIRQILQAYQANVVIPKLAAYHAQHLSARAILGDVLEGLGFALPPVGASIG